MDIFAEKCLEIINKIEGMILFDENKDHDEEILSYLEEQRKKVENCRNVSNDER